MTETIRIDDLTVLHAQPVRATRQPVVFVHGYLATASVFTNWLPFFAARGFPAYAVNLRGREGSRPNIDLGRASMHDFADDASAVARQVGAHTVVGHSMGGLVAQMLAVRGDVKAAALVTPAPPRGITVLSLDLAIKQLKYLPAIFRSRLVHPDHDDLREIVLNRVPPDQQGAILRELVPDSGRAARDMSITGVPVDARAVRCPLFIMAAEHDRFIPKAIVARIANRYSTPLQTAAGRGHMLVLEPGWETIADSVASWIESVEAR